MLSTLPWNSMKKKYYIIHEFFTLYKLYYRINFSSGIHILSHFLSWLSNRHLQKLHLFSINFLPVLFWFTFWKIKIQPFTCNIFHYITIIIPSCPTKYILPLPFIVACHVFLCTCVLNLNEMGFFSYFCFT